MRPPVMSPLAGAGYRPAPVAPAPSPARTPAQILPRMEVDFARWYLWARDLQQAHPEDQEVGVLVTLLRRVHDLEERRRLDPEGTPANLVEMLGDSVVALVRRLLARYPGSNPPR